MNVVLFKPKKKSEINLWPITVSIKDLLDATIAVAIIEQDMPVAGIMLDTAKAALTAGFRHVDIKNPQVLAYRKYLDISSEGAEGAHKKMYEVLHEVAMR